MTIPLKEIKKVVKDYEKNNSQYAIVSYLSQMEINAENEFYVKSKLGQAYTTKDNPYYNDYQKGVELLRWVDEKEKGKNSRTQFHLAYAHYHLSRYEEALEYANRGVKLDTNFVDNYYVKAKYYEKIWYYTGVESDFNKAKQEFEKYHKLSKNKDKEALLWLAELYQKKIDEEYTEELYLRIKEILGDYRKGKDYAWGADNIIRQIDEIKKAAQQPQEVIPVPAYTSDWHIYSEELHGNSCIIKVDRGLRGLLPLDNFQEQIWIVIPSKYSRHDGLTPDMERKIIDEIEYAFSQKLGAQNAIYAGYFQKNGAIEFIFYSNSIKHLQRKLDQVMFHFKKYQFDWEVNTASTWLDYTDLMLPEEGTLVSSKA